MYDDPIPQSYFDSLHARPDVGAAAEPEDAEPARFQCRHIFTDGHRCGSPALRNENFCYFHHTSRRPIQDAGKRRRRQGRFALRMPEDRAAIQLTLGEVLQKLANNDLDPRRAGLLLYGLQIASLNLPKQPAAARDAKPVEPVDEITRDPEHGEIAPVEEYVGPREKVGSAQRLLDELDNMSEATRARLLGEANTPVDATGGWLP